MKRKHSSDKPINLRFIGFCGADDSVEPGLLAAVSATHPWVEWGVLFREAKEGLPRYGSPAWLEKLGAVNANRTMRLAGHLCYPRVDELLRGETAFVKKLHDEVGFQRFQINATAANGTDTPAMFGTDAAAEQCVAALRSACAKLPHVEFILQRNKETRPLWERLVDAMPPNMSMLFDDSMGLGVSTTSWPSPPAEASGLKFGYAGGLKPSNLDEQLELITQTAPVRTSHLDCHCMLLLSACIYYCAAAFPYAHVPLLLVCVCVIFRGAPSGWTWSPPFEPSSRTAQTYSM